MKACGPFYGWFYLILERWLNQNFICQSIVSKNGNQNFKYKIIKQKSQSKFSSLLYQATNQPLLTSFDEFMLTERQQSMQVEKSKAKMNFETCFKWCEWLILANYKLQTSCKCIIHSYIYAI